MGWVRKLRWRDSAATSSVTTATTPALSATTRTSVTARRRRKRPGERSSATFESVPHTTDRGDVGRRMGGLAELVPQALHRHVDEAGVAEVVVAPDPLEEHLPGQDAGPIADELDEQPELRRRQEQLLVGPERPPGRHVDAQVATDEEVVVAGGGAGVVLVGAAEDGADAGGQHGRFERLGDVVVRPELEAGDDVARIGP